MIDISSSAHRSDPADPSLWRSFRRHWLFAMFFYGISMALVFAVLLIVPRKYASEGKLFVLLGRGAVTLDPTATTGKNVHVQETRDSEINSIADILQSRAIVEQVVDKIGVDRVLESNFVFADWVKLPEIEIPSFSEPKVIQADQNVDYKALKRRERAIRQLASDLKVKATKKAATITISCRASTPWLAQEIAKTLIDRYQDLHIRAHHTAGSYPFFEEQYGFHQEKMAAVRSDLRDLKNELGLASIEGARGSLQMRMDSADLGLMQADADLAAARERVTRLKTQYDAIPPEITTASVSGNANEGADLMRDRLFELEVREKELVARFNENHPEVQNVRESINTARRILNDYPYDRREVTTAVNPTRLDVERRLLIASADERSLATRRDALQDKRQELLAMLETLNRNEAKIHDLQQELLIAESNFRTYAEKTEEARINQALDSERISNVNVVQAPTLMVKAVSPKRALIFLASAVLLAIVSVALTQIVEPSEPTSRPREESTTSSELPGLGPRGTESGRRVMQTL